MNEALADGEGRAGVEDRGLPGSLGSAHPAPAHPQRGGVLLRALGAAVETEASFFVPAEVVVEIAALGTVTRAPGLIPPVSGIALAHGAVATVIDIGALASDGGTATPAATDARRRAYRAGADWQLPGSEAAVLCSVGGELVALSGGRVVATGTFDAVESGSDGGGDGGVTWRDAVVPALDVRALYVRAEQAIWTARAAARARAVAP